MKGARAGQRHWNVLFLSFPLMNSSLIFFSLSCTFFFFKTAKNCKLVDVCYRCLTFIVFSNRFWMIWIWCVWLQCTISTVDTVACTLAACWCRLILADRSWRLCPSRCPSKQSIGTEELAAQGPRPTEMQPMAAKWATTTLWAIRPEAKFQDPASFQKPVPAPAGIHSNLIK